MATKESTLPPAAARGQAPAADAHVIHDARGGAPQLLKPLRPAKSGCDDAPATLDEAIEQQRERMFRACSVLACLSHVLLYQDDFESGQKGASFADLADIAHELVAEAADQLDSVCISKLPRSD